MLYSKVKTFSKIFENSFLKNGLLEFSADTRSKYDLYENRNHKFTRKIGKMLFMLFSKIQMMKDA